MKIEIASVDSVIIYFGDKISKEINSEVKRSYRHLKDLNNRAILGMIPSYNSLFITYDIFKYDYSSIKEYLEEELSLRSLEERSDGDLITIDVYYGEEVGLDLKAVANEKKISIEEVVKIHSEKIYDVYAIGFLAGFAYLGMVDKKINSPRLQTPRKKIPKGSVAIANEQTAIYPSDSPGGWKILGKTAFELLDMNDKQLSPITINSQIKFNPISKAQFLQQGGIL